MTKKPFKLTPTLQTSLCDAVSNGTPLSLAASRHGIDQKTLSNWETRGARALSGKYFKFCKAIVQADLDLNTKLFKIAYDGAYVGNVMGKKITKFDANNKILDIQIKKIKIPPDPKLALKIQKMEFHPEIRKQFKKYIAKRTQEISVELKKNTSIKTIH